MAQTKTVATEGKAIGQMKTEIPFQPIWPQCQKFSYKTGSVCPRSMLEQSEALFINFEEIL